LRALSVKYSFFEKNNTGYVVSRIHNEALALQGFLWDFFVQVFTDVMMFGIGIYFIFKFSVKLALISLAILPLFSLILKIFSKKIKEHSNYFQEEYSRVYGFFYDSVNLIFLLKVLLLEKYSDEKLKGRLHLLYKVKLKNYLVNGFYTTSVMFISGIAPIVVLYVGGVEVIRGHMSLGSLIAFNSFLNYIFGPTKNMLSYGADLISTMVSFKRIREILKLETETARFEELQGVDRIEFKNVSFAYDKDPVLKNISFELRKGEKIGVLGKIGSGKTTLMKLLMGLYNDYTGEITFNDKSIRTIKRLTEKIGIIPQDNYLFSESIIENIRLGNLNRDIKDIPKIIDRLQMNDLLVKKGRDFCLNSEGSDLSGGEKQKIAAARVMFRDPEIVIIDEGTSNLDAKNEFIIKQSIFEQFNDSLIIVISHRFNNILDCDRIMYMKNGEIIDIDTHDNLFQKHSDYKDLYLKQNENYLITKKKYSTTQRY
jgi:ABC-type bacteriocin/lantibiotic exporter with double-glycine peptidase domain